jgi:hypothetical protein
MAWHRLGDTSVTSHNKTYKTEDAHGPAIMTVAASFGHNISRAHL